MKSKFVKLHGYRLSRWLTVKLGLKLIGFRVATVFFLYVRPKQFCLMTISCLSSSQFEFFVLYFWSKSRKVNYLEVQKNSSSWFEGRLIEPSRMGDKTQSLTGKSNPLYVGKPENFKVLLDDSLKKARSLLNTFPLNTGCSWLMRKCVFNIELTLIIEWVSIKSSRCTECSFERRTFFIAENAI